ncbi:MAG: energy-coupling factor transporter transmembrane component T [Thermoproteota archaeon]|nr:energy-coupling factor transporter transmembrane protein EcfT [Candidatus Brockarchaeota archaeon]MBO3801560.1 energy-coupling factor transporter transmembrane protein EcfT [Candidatus Brockarchaeota archaeon]
MSNLSIDPRVKLSVFFLLFTFSFFLSSISSALILIVLCLAISALDKVLKKVVRKLIIFIPMLVVALLLWTFFSSFSLFYVKNENMNILNGVFMSTRLFLFLTISMTFIFTTTPEEMIKGLDALHFPKSLVFLFGLSLREIDSVSRDFISIKESQASRGLELDKGSLVKRIRNHIPILIPLLVRSVESAEKLTLAMELKAFNLSNKRRSSNLKLSKTDFIILVIVTFVGLTAVFLLR